MPTQIPKSHEMLSGLIKLRTPIPADYPEIKILLNEKETMASLIQFFGRDTWSDEQVRERHEKFQKNQDEGLGMTYAVIDLRTNKIVGTCGFKHIDLNDKKCEFGLIIHRSVWGSGIARDCHRLCLSYAFTELGIEKIFFETDSSNKRMQGFFKKMGIPFVRITSNTYLNYELDRTNWIQIHKKFE